MASQKFKSDVRIDANLKLNNEVASRALVIDSSKNIVSSPVTSTELAHVSGVTSPIQTQINNEVSRATAAEAANSSAISAEAAARAAADTDLQSNIDAEESRALAAEGALDTRIDALEADGSLAAHLSDTVDAHDASAISSVASGNLAATNVQTALNELQSDIDTRALDSTVLKKDGSVDLAGTLLPSIDLTYNLGQADRKFSEIYATRLDADTEELVLQGSAISANDNKIVNVADPVSAQDAATKAYVDAADAALDSRVDTIEDDYGTAGGLATLDGGGKVPLSQLPSAVMTYEGVWNASTNSPALADGSGDAGMVYRVGTAGSQDLGSGSISFGVGDYVIYNGAEWEKSDTTDAVASVNGYTGIVTLEASDLAIDSISGISATDVQGALAEISGDVTSEASRATSAEAALDSRVDALEALSSVGDIAEASFSIANNQASPANVTGLVFANAAVRSFEALVSLEMDATADNFEVFSLKGIQKGSSWDMSVSSTGDDSGLAFSINSAGQVQYTSANTAGFVSGILKYRAMTTSV